MKLHENKELFADAILAASLPKQEGGLGIKSIFIEKDYWICRSLSLMVENDQEERAIFKGGTSLTKAYGIGSRFSEDIDIAIAEAWSLSGNQLKSLIRKTAKNMTLGLSEMNIPGSTSKGSHYYKAFYNYPREVESTQAGAIKAGQLLIEINSFANPYPSERCTLKSFLTDFFVQTNNQALIEDYEMQPFTVPVLDKRRTLTEKLVSIIRCSLASNPILELTAKIRHFYDLHYLFQDKECKVYLETNSFKEDFYSLIEHDQKSFDKPEGWQNKAWSESPLITDFHLIWESLKNVYLRELPDLAYQKIASVEEIEESVKNVIYAIGK